MDHAFEIWNALVNKYVVQDDGTKNYPVGNFLNFQMEVNKDVSVQIKEFLLAALQLKNEGMKLLEPFVTAALIEKLPDSWRDYKNGIKHKRKGMHGS